MKRSLSFVLAVMVLMAVTAVAFADDEIKCDPWQHEENGQCVDNPGVHHHHGHYDPAAGEQCWVECMCYEGQYPANQSCAPCSYVGMVCQ